MAQRSLDLLDGWHGVAPAPRLSLTIDVSDERPEAAPALAGMRLGWNQLLDNLAGHLLTAGPD